MARRIDEIQLISLTIRGAIGQTDRLRFNGDATFAFQVHCVEHLIGHFPIGQTMAGMDEAIGQGRFAMVDVRDDGKVADQVLCG